MTYRIVALAFGILLSIPVAAQTSDRETTFPTESQIALLVTQSERAFDQYESAIELESQTFAGTKTKNGSSELVSVTRDRDVLLQARRVLATIKKNPKSFNSPMGFLLIGALDDASRNMALCGGQAGAAIYSDVVDKSDFGKASRKLHLSQTCIDSSTLLFTVSETAFDMYSQYLGANYALEQELVATVTKTRDALKKCSSGAK